MYSKSLVYSCICCACWQALKRELDVKLRLVAQAAEDQLRKAIVASRADVAKLEEQLTVCKRSEERVQAELAVSLLLGMPTNGICLAACTFTVVSEQHVHSL